MNLGPTDFNGQIPGSNLLNNPIDEMEDIDLGILHPDPFMDTARRIETKFPCGSFQYLDYVELEKDEKGFQHIGLKPYNRFFEVGTFQIEVPLREDQIEDIKSMHGIDLESIMKDSLIVESMNQMKKNLYSKYKDLGEKTRQSVLNKLWSKLESKWSIPAEVVLKNGESVGKILGVKIVAASNSVAVSSRRGPADFVVLNSMLGSIIADCPEFNFIDNGTKFQTGIHQIGVFLGNIKVFVNPFEPENIAIVGRTPKENDPGVHVFEYVSHIRRVKYQDPYSLEIKQNTCVRNRSAFVEVGQRPESSYRLMRFVFEDNIPIWKKLLNKLIKPPSL